MEIVALPWAALFRLSPRPERLQGVLGRHRSKNGPAMRIRHWKLVSRNLPRQAKK